MRYVPQSNYFDPSDLTTETSILYPGEKEKNPYPAKLFISKTIRWGSMCGIAGYISFRKDPSFSMEALLKLMEHRGPDENLSYRRR